MTIAIDYILLIGKRLQCHRPINKYPNICMLYADFKFLSNDTKM